MALLSTLRPSKGSKRNIKRIGRGDGSGHGGTSGKGHKGQLARTSSDVSRGFEGGQMPIHRRSPKWGFTNISQITYVPLNLDLLSAKFKAGEEVTPETLKSRGIIQRTSDPIKILGRGKLTHSLKITVHAASKSAVKAIEGAKASLTLIQEKSDSKKKSVKA